MASDVKRCRTDELALLVLVYRSGCRGEAAGPAIADLDEYQALPVAHDQVDFSGATAEIPPDEFQALAAEVVERDVLGFAP